MSLKIANLSHAGHRGGPAEAATAAASDPDDMRLAAWDYPLPPELIAQAPLKQRDACRLMLVRVAKGRLRAISHHVFGELPELLPPSLFLANNARVTPVRLFGQRPGGGRAEFLLLTPLPLLRAQARADGWQEAAADGLARPVARLKEGQTLSISPDLGLTILGKGEFGHVRVMLRWRGDLAGVLGRVGHLPLPPYIRRPDTPDDAQAYQTTYARADRAGAAAAPTAGLHFTPALREDMRARGHTWEELTLYVGYGTFSPVRAADIRDHAMHAEYVDVPEAAARAVREAKAAGRPVAAVGTTAVRALEGMMAACGQVAPWQGQTSLFLFPGRPLRVVDHLVTNFHLPGSSLMMLVATLTGREGLLTAYREAIEKGYRFFSYGDAMLVRCEE